MRLALDQLLEAALRRALRIPRDLTPTEGEVLFKEIDRLREENERLRSSAGQS